KQPLIQCYYSEILLYLGHIDKAQHLLEVWGHQVSSDCQDNVRRLKKSAQRLSAQSYPPRLNFPDDSGEVTATFILSDGRPLPLQDVPKAIHSSPGQESASHSSTETPQETSAAPPQQHLFSGSSSWQPLVYSASTNLREVTQTALIRNIKLRQPVESKQQDGLDQTSYSETALIPGRQNRLRGQSLSPQSPTKTDTDETAIIPGRHALIEAQRSAPNTLTSPTHQGDLSDPEQPHTHGPHNKGTSPRRHQEIQHTQTAIVLRRDGAHLDDPYFVDHYGGVEEVM
ncbi:MAG: hypothetical protein HOI66_21935, partial [Verrucomicrobia bacterium]|nr:hypothetical protein [Verrucomicrobiota bacterium]